jgi:hypothetical protein
MEHNHLEYPFLTEDEIGLLYAVEGAYIVDFASVVNIYRCAHYTTKVDEEPLHKYVGRVASYLFLDLALTCGSIEAEEVFLRTRSRTAASSGTGSSF